MVVILFIVENIALLGYAFYKLYKASEDTKREELVKHFNELCASRPFCWDDETCEGCVLKDSTVCNKPLGEVTNEELRAGIKLLESSKGDENNEDH